MLIDERDTEGEIEMDRETDRERHREGKQARSQPLGGFVILFSVK